MNTKQSIFKVTIVYHLIGAFVILTLLWLYVRPFDPTVMNDAKDVWSSWYWVFAAFAGVFGIMVSRKLDFFRSFLGGTVLFFSLGVLLQGLGQVIDVYNTALYGGNAPYPSWAEFGYSGSIIAYIFGAYWLARYITKKSLFNTRFGTMALVFVPVSMFSLSYFVFLRDYDFGGMDPVRVLFDFGYPVLQTVYVTLAILAYLHSKNLNGGSLKKPLLLLMSALMLQYVTDAYFVYLYDRDMWFSANLNDYMYAVCYFILALSLVYIENIMNFLSSDDANVSNPIDHPNLSELYRITAKQIIKAQKEIIGPVAITEATMVHNVKMLNSDLNSITLDGDPRQAIDRLIDKYTDVFGPLAHRVSYRATRKLMSDLPEDLVPDKLKQVE